MRPGAAATGCVVLLTLLSVTFSANEARACRRLPTTPIPENHTGRDWAIAMSSFGAMNAAFVTAQLVLGDELFAPEFAIFELSVGIGQSILAAIVGVSAGLSGFSSCDTDPWQTYGWQGAAGLALTSAWLIAHAFWSLSAARDPDVLPTLSIDAQGASLGIVGRF